MTDGYSLIFHNENGFRIMDHISEAPAGLVAFQVDAGNSYVHVIDRVLYNVQLINE